MELMAASRIVRAMGRIAAARPYYRELSEIVRDLANAAGLPSSPYTGPLDEAAPAAIIVVTSDRGLCGGYNSSVLRATEEILQRRHALGQETVLVGVGKKSQNYLRYRGVDVDRQVLGVTEAPRYEQVIEVVGDLLERFERGEIGSISVVSNRFVSAGVQYLWVNQVVPLEPEEVTAGSGSASLDFEYEPSPEAIVVPLLRQFAMAKIFALFLEASAAEFASRQKAMKAASDNADELTTQYKRILNRARQDSITTEIMEIVSGAEALKTKVSTDEI